MKRNLIALISLILIFAVFFTLGAGILLKNQLDHYYAKSMIVFNLDEENAIVVLKDSNGNTWEFTGLEDWEVNDICSCLMHDNNTSTIYDDTIVLTRYDGQIIGWVIK